MIDTIKSKLHSLFNDEKFKEILHGSIYSFSAKIIVSLLGIITSIIGARYYGAEMIGLVAILGTVLGIAGLFAVFGMSTSMLRLIPEYYQKYSIGASIALYKKFLGLVLVVSSIVAIIVFILSETIANTVFHKPELTWFISLAAVVLIFQAVGNVNITMIRSLKKIKLFALLELTPKVISLLLLLIFTFMFYDQYNLIYIAFSVSIIMTILTSGYLISYISSCSKKISSNILPSNKDILALSFPMFLTGGLFVIIGQTDIVMIGMFRSASEVGVYSIVFSLAMLTTFVISSINVMAAPKFSELYHAGKMDELQHVVQKSSKLMFWTTLPILLVLFLFGKLILSIYGEEFVIGYMALIFLIMGQFVNALSGSVGHLLNMTGYQKEFRNIMLIAAIINISMNYILLPEYGINGAAFASLLSVVFWNIASIIFIKQRFGFTIAYLPLKNRLK